ncbi:MAG: hypothetical protein ACQESR_02370 [Planctomycetota bacterium]
MLFVHFTPKANLKRIKRVGLRRGKGEDGVFLRPLLQGEKVLTNDWNGPGWWKKGTARHDNQMAKIVVRIPDDEPIRYGDCGDSRSGERITVKDFGKVAALWNPDRDSNPLWRPCGMGALLLCDECDKDYATWFGCEVLYDRVIPVRWIVNIYDHTNSDARTKRYRRDKRAGPRIE